MRAVRREGRVARIRRAIDCIFTSQSDSDDDDKSVAHKKDLPVKKKLANLSSGVAARRMRQKPAGKSRFRRKMPTRSTVEWPPTLQRRECPEASDQNANIAFLNQPPTSLNFVPDEPTRAPALDSLQRTYGSTRGADVPIKPENVFPDKLYEAEIARQVQFSSAAGTIRRRLTPCCSQFYAPMVLLGKLPPFEGKNIMRLYRLNRHIGLLPCKEHYNLFTTWRRFIVQSEAKREVMSVFFLDISIFFFNEGQGDGEG
jgi:hypothetical protein